MGAGRWASGQNGGVCLQKGNKKHTHGAMLLRGWVPLFSTVFSLTFIRTLSVPEREQLLYNRCFRLTGNIFCGRTRLQRL